MKNEYTIQEISDGNAVLGKHFRITDADDNRVATCYELPNAKMICDALNLISERQRLEALIVNDSGTGWKQKATVYYDQMCQWQEYASYLSSCAKSGESEVMSFEIFTQDRMKRVTK